MKREKVILKKLNSLAKTPVYSSDFAAGADLYAATDSDILIAPANKVGVIDSDYRGEIIVSLHNHSGRPQTISAGERIAQLVIAPYIRAEFEESDTLDETKRGSGGFGSTGTK